MTWKTKNSHILLAAVLLLAMAAMAADGPKWIGAFFVKGRVGLKWQTFEGAKEYNIHRKVGSGDFEKIHSTEKTQYFDTGTTPGEVHTYKISVVDGAGKELFSGEKTVSVPGGTAAGAFKPPTWSGVRWDRQGIRLNYDKVPGAIAYNILRSTTPGGPYEIVGNTPSTRYADRQDLVQGTTYYYVVQGMNEDFEETEYSEEKSIKYGLSAEEIAAADTVKIELEELILTHLFTIEDAGNLGTLNQPADVFVNSKGNIYVSDTRRFRINCYDPKGKHLFSFGQKTEKIDLENPPEGTFTSPMPIFIDKQDQVWVGDNTNHDIQVFTADGKFIRRIRVDVGPDKAAFRPNGLVVLDDGRIVATDAGNHRLLVLDKDGKILAETDHGGTGETEEDKLWMSFPAEVVMAADGKTVCVIDQMGARVQQFGLDCSWVRTFGKAGYGIGEFGRPKGIALGEDGRLWVSDGMANTIQVFTFEGEPKAAITKFEGSDEKLTSPAGMFIKDGKFYIVTRLTARVHVFKIG